MEFRSGAIKLEITPNVNLKENSIYNSRSFLSLYFSLAGEVFDFNHRVMAPMTWK